MTEHARRPTKHATLGPVPIDETHTVGEEALHFTRWFSKSKYHLMGQFFGELSHGTGDVTALQERYCRALHHGQRVLQARTIVTVILALGIIAAAASAVANALQADVGTDLLDRAAAVSTSATVVLVAIRLLLDRYLERCDIAATFVAIQLAVSASRGPAPSPPSRA